MGIITPAAPVTPEELLELPDAVNYELVDGKLVERHTGLESSEIAARIIILIGTFIRARKLGRLFGADAGYQCFPDAPGKVRKPDVSFVRAGRLKDDRAPKGHCFVPPDLVIEVVSPGDLAHEIEEKVVEYLGAGVPLVWVVYPPTRTVEIRRPRASAQGPVSQLADADTISGEEVLPGFSCAVSEFFN
jgi:Uma2 family endonuclease